MSTFRTVYPRNRHGREVRISATGIVVVEDQNQDGTWTHTRVSASGRTATVTASSQQAAIDKARKMIQKANTRHE
jgi:hypothetical protein